MTEPLNLERRAPVWEALSELFVGKELQSYDYAAIAEALRASGYSLDELERVLHEEVAPVFRGNLSTLAVPEMEGWTQDTDQGGVFPLGTITFCRRVMLFEIDQESHFVGEAVFKASVDSVGRTLAILVRRVGDDFDHPRIGVGEMRPHRVREIAVAVHNVAVEPVADVVERDGGYGRGRHGLAPSRGVVDEAEWCMRYPMTYRLVPSEL